MSTLAAVGVAALFAVTQVASQPEQPVLSGPKVQASEQAATLVERDFHGRVRRLDVSPEEAAIDLLGLDPETLERVERALSERWAIIDRVVRENVEVLVELVSAQAAGETRAVLGYVRHLLGEMSDLRARGRLEDELAPLLEPSQRERFRALVREYRRALVEDTIAEASAKGERLGRFQAGVRLSLEEIGLEIRRSYERLVEPAQAELERLLMKLDLSPEQEGEIRRLIEDFAQETKLNPTEKQRRQLFWQLASKLNAKQFRRLIDEVRGTPSEPQP